VVVDIGPKTSGEMRGTRYDMCRRGERETPPEILGEAILVISG
jgi:hypothetical protein